MSTPIQISEADMSKITDARLDERIAAARHDAETQLSVRYKREAEEDLSVLTELRALRSKSDAVGVTYYDEGKYAEWFEALSDDDFATRASYAAMDIADGDFENVENYLPVVAILCNAADRLRRLINDQCADVEAMRVTEALRELMAIVKIHSQRTGKNFAWAEMENAEAALVAALTEEGA